MAGAASRAGGEWRGAVDVREAVELAELLTERLPASTAFRALSVTDLVAPRRAYWRTLAPTPIEPSRQERIDLGRSVHRRLGMALASEGTLEARVRRDGAVGRIDLVSDVPVEVKSSASAVPPVELLAARPDQVEQLAMYCGLAERPAGRLVTVVVEGRSVGPVQAVDIAFSDIAPIRVEMRRRGDALREAWRARRADALPPCRWFGRGCEFQVAGACDCTPSEGNGSSPIISAVTDVRDRPDVAARIEARLGAVRPTESPPTLERFRDLLYPRRAYFERTSPEPMPESPRPGPGDPLDVYARVAAALESGPVGEVARLAPHTPEPEEDVGGFRGAPYLLRSSRARARASSADLLEAHPQYALELGLRCVATGTSRAYLLLGRERATGDRDRVQAFELQFSPTTAFSRLWRERVRLLERAFATGSPLGLPACPEWMYDDCPYRSECGCGARSQR